MSVCVCVSVRVCVWISAEHLYIVDALSGPVILCNSEVFLGTNTKAEQINPFFIRDIHRQITVIQTRFFFQPR